MQYHFFAGLYFIYHLNTALTFTYLLVLRKIFTLLPAFIAYSLYEANYMQYAVLTKNKWHIMLDALLFENLAVINVIAFKLCKQQPVSYSKLGSITI